MACFETGVVSHSSLGLEKQIRPGWGPAGGWEACGDEHRRWTQLDSHSQGPHILTTARRVPMVTGADLKEGGGGDTPPESIRMRVFSSLAIVGAANQLVMFCVPVPISKMDRVVTLLSICSCVVQGWGQYAVGLLAPMCFILWFWDHIGAETFLKTD